jgi:hypothetical protein
MALALAWLCPGEVFMLDEVTVAGVRTQGKDHITREDARGTGSDLLFLQQPSCGELRVPGEVP